MRLEGPGIPKVALAMIRDGGGDWLSSRQVWSCLPSHTELKTHRWRVSKGSDRLSDRFRASLIDHLLCRWEAGGHSVSSEDVEMNVPPSSLPYICHMCS